jgi:hypothetical protein
VTAYLSIAPQQEPHDLGLDDSGSGRIVYVFNVLALKRPSATLLRDLIGILVAAGVGVENVNIFASSKAVIPDASVPGAPPAILHLKATGGTPPIGTHNDGPGAYRRPGAQVFVYGTTTQAAEAMVYAAYNALIGVRNQEVAS